VGEGEPDEAPAPLSLVLRAWHELLFLPKAYLFTAGPGGRLEVVIISRLVPAERHPPLRSAQDKPQSLSRARAHWLGMPWSLVGIYRCNRAGCLLLG
jgi:hypothetical protein